MTQHSEHRRLRHGHHLAGGHRCRPSSRAMRDAGFSQVMLVGARPRRPRRRARRRGRARCATAACASPASRCCATSRACPATCTTTRSTSPSRCSRCARALGCDVLLACSSTSHARHAGPRRARARPAQARDAGACRSASRSPTKACRWGRTINEFTDAWDVVCRADAPNLGIGHRLVPRLRRPRRRSTTSTTLDPDKIFLVQLADFMWQEIRTFEERIATARHFRVFPGEGVHSDAARRAGAAARRARLPRRLQLRGVQRRLPADAAGHGGASARAASAVWLAKTCCAARCRCPARCG